jgi:glycosyltransferase involved in cell wall biosynthesis
VSVVIPTYNSAPLLKKALLSVLNQTYQDFEVIIINNFSTDNTVEVVNSLNNGRVRLINFKNEGIIGKSRNVGIREARGDWIAFLDSDDRWYPEKLEVTVKAIGENPEAILFAHRLLNVREGEAIGSNELGRIPDDMYGSLLFQGSRFATSAGVARKTALIDVGGFAERPDFTGVEDYDLWLRLSKIGKFHFIDKVLGDYAIHAYNFSGDVEKRAKHWLSVLETHFNELPDKGNFERQIKSARVNVLFNAGWNNLKRGDFREARKWFYKSLKTNPLSLKLYVGIILSLFRIKVSNRLNSIAIRLNNVSRKMSDLSHLLRNKS